MKGTNILIAFFCFFLVTACSTRSKFNPSTEVPAARGTVKVKQDKNNNYQIAVSVKHLAEPQRLSPSRQHYIVWVETEQGGYKNVGQLVTSRSLNASVNAVTPHSPIRVFITAENDSNVQSPGSTVVLNTYLKQ